MSVPKFSNGTMVEVKSDEEGYQGSWYPAVIVDSVGNDKFLVKYKTLKTDDESELLKEKTDASDIRPCPPVIQRLDRFKMLEEVDAWYNDGWWMGLIYKVLDGLKYAVYFWSTNEELEFDHFNLRPHQEWIDGKWVISFRKKPKLAVKPTIAKMKVPYGGGASIANFCNGTRVEVESGEGDYVDIWFPAIILGPVCNGKYLVEYLTLRTDDDGTKLLKEEVDAPRIRPCPCVIQRVERFKPLEEVDAWYGGGWWVGQVYKVFVGSNYTVYFRSTNEVLEFQHSYLRPHQDWTNGNWITATRGTDLMNSE